MSERFQKDVLLSSSSDGRVQVHRGLDLSNSHKPIALKYQLHCSLSYANLTLREALNQARLVHPNVCQVLDCQVKGLPSGQVETVLALELMEDGDLMQEIERRMRTRQKWQERKVVEILEKVLLALVYAQENGICHRDVKPQNIFLDRETCVKVGDFGSSTALADADTAALFSLQGSPFYLSPELKAYYLSYLASGLTGVRHDPYKSDVYSLGVMVLFMVRLKAPFELANLDRLREKTELILRDCGEYPVTQALLRVMLEVDPERRISLVDLLKLVKRSKYPGRSEQTQACAQVSPTSKSDIDPPNTDKDVLCIVCTQPVPHFPTTPNPNLADYTCSLDCAKRLDADGFNSCLVCKLPRNTRSQADLPTVLPCGHFYHDIVCLYKALKEASQDFCLPADYKCSYCKRRVPDEMLEEAFSKANESEFVRLGETKKCVICREKPGILVQSCKHPRCLECAGHFTKSCPCTREPSACVLS